MAVVVEDGTIVSGANSYIDSTYLTAYIDDRGITLSGTYTAAVLIIRAMDYIESLNFKGVKYTKDQSLQWPRVDVLVDNYYIDADEIPAILKEGQAEAVLAIDREEDPLGDVEKDISKTSVGSVSIEYKLGSSSKTIIRKISNKLYKLLANGDGGNSFNVNRG